VGKKQPGEKRVAVLGGSTTWGFGLTAGQSFPAQLQNQLRARRSSSGAQVSILNLGFNNDGAYSFKYTLRDYSYLDYDAVVFYSGYNDLSFENKIVFRHRSPIFGWTGYLPLLPESTVDKLIAWKARFSGQSEPAIHPPSPAEIDESLDKQSGQPGSPNATDKESGSCSPKWQFYCQQMSEAISLALGQGKSVLVVTEPYISDEHIEQQVELADMLRQHFAGTRVTYLNLGRAVDLRDKSLCWDSMHLTEEGNRRIAAALAQPVTEILR
jgi:lysophospholipase L1-like esterase